MQRKCHGRPKGRALMNRALTIRILTIRILMNRALMNRLLTIRMLMNRMLMNRVLKSRVLMNRMLMSRVLEAQAGGARGCLFIVHCTSRFSHKFFRVCKNSKGS